MIYSGWSIGHLRTSNLDVRGYRLSIVQIGDSKGFQVRVLNEVWENGNPVELHSRCVTTASESTAIVKIEVVLTSHGSYPKIRTVSRNEHHVQLFCISSLQLGQTRLTHIQRNKTKISVAITTPT